MADTTSEPPIPSPPLPEQPQQQQQNQNQASTLPPQNDSQQLQQLQHQMDNLQIDEPPKQESDNPQDKQVPENKKNELLDNTNDFVEVNRTNVCFGKNNLFPGSIEEVDIVIGLKEDSLEENENNDPYMLRVIAKCNDAEFDALDEYVFSVRSNERFEYFEEVRFKIRKREKAQVKVAVKIPPVKSKYSLSGTLEIQLQSLEPIFLPITALCQVPQITCIKDLYKTDEDCSMIKIPAKKNQIRMPPIPFKNLSPYNMTLQVEAISNQNFGNRAYDIATQNLVNCQANMQFFVNLQLKQNFNYKGVMPARDTIRKVLVLKIKNSSVYFNYPIEVHVYEGVVGAAS